MNAANLGSAADFSSVGKHRPCITGWRLILDDFAKLSELLNQEGAHVQPCLL